MTASSAFVDTSGFFALLSKKDSVHGLAAEWLKQVRSNRRRSVTTDYVLDETATLLKARGRRDLIPAFFEFVMPSRALEIEWIGSSRFEETRQFFLRHKDHDYSFTDCTSFVVMRQLGLAQALTKDAHFREAGFIPLLPTE